MKNLFVLQDLLKLFFEKNGVHQFLLFEKIFIILFLFYNSHAYSQIIYQHDFGTTDIDTYPYIIAPKNFETHLSNSSWTNTTNKWTSYTGSTGQAIALNNSSGTPKIDLTFQVASGYELTISQFNFWSQRSNTGATDWSMTINGISVGSGNIPTDGTATGNTNVSNPVSGLSGTIIVEISLSGASEHGTFRLDDFTLIGSVSPIQTYYRSRQSGDWSSATTWEKSTDNVNWSNASTTPTSNTESILIQAGNTVNVANSISLDQTTIAGTLELQTGGTLNINDGDGDDITIPSGGVLKVTSPADYSTSIQQSANANINIATDGKIEIGDGSSSTGEGYEGFATSTINVWNDGAIYEYNIDRAFEAPGLTYFPNASETETPVFRVSSVSGTPGSGSSSDFQLNGILEVYCDLTFSGTGDKYLRDGVRGNYTLTQTGSGQLFLNGLNPVLDGDLLKIVLAGNLELTTDAEIPSGAYVMISGSYISNNVTDGTLFTINGTLDVTDQGIRNTNGSIILNGTFRTANSGGFSGSGSSIVSGDITINPGSTVELYANGDQSLNDDDFSNLILSGSGIKKPTGSFSPAGTVTIKDNAIFDCRGRNIGDETSSGPTATNLTMSGNSRLIVDTHGPNPKMAGVYNLSGGVIEFKGSGSVAQNIRSKNYQNIEVTGTNVGMSDGKINLNSNGKFTVKTGGVFWINDNTIAGSGDHSETIKIENGGTFECGTNMGFNGAWITSAPIKSSAINADIQNIILEPGSTVDYSRTGDQPDQPITNAGGLIYQNLIISGTGNKTAPSDNLIIQGNFSKTSAADFIHNNGTVIFDGTDVQNYSSASPQMIFNNLTNQNQNIGGLNINDSLSVYNQLSLEDNSLLNLNADITLLSNKDQTASIGQLGTNANIHYGNGRFIVERYINTNTTDGGHPKSWQLISTPAFGETIFDTWQEKGSKTISGYGTWITDKSGAANGFDTISAAPSMKYYDAVTNSWLGISGTDINLENAKGYLVFVRGDRQARKINSSATPTVLRTRGKIYSPEFLPPVSTVSPGKFQCVGNPYPSAIDFSKISSTNIESSYTAWDPTLGGIYGLGGYQTISEAANYQAVPGNTANYNTTSDYRNIQSGQAFFVFNYTALPGSVSFTEACKLSGNQHLVNREPITERPVLFADLISDEIIRDGNAVAFDQKFSNKVDGEDALKINNAGENFAIKEDGKILAVEAHNEIKAGDTIFYRLNNLSKQHYQLSFAPQNISSGLEAYLIDQYLKKEIRLSLTDTSFVNFSISSDKASAMPNRFYLVFRAAGPLPVSFLSMSAYPQNGNVRIEWKAQNENGIQDYQVEYSSDGIHFSNIGIVNPKNSVVNNYEFIHHQPKTGNDFYRITIDKNDGEVEYEKVARVWIPESKSSIEVYPNPVSDGIIKLQFINQPPGKYFLSLYNSIGQKIFSKEINCKNRNSIQALQQGKNFIRGIYHLEIIKPDGDRKTIKVRN